MSHRFFHRVLNFEIFSKFRLCKIHRFFHRVFSCDRVFHIFFTVFSQVFIQYWKYPILGHEKLTPVHQKFRASVPNNIYKIYTIYWNFLNLCYIYSQLFHKEIELVHGIISGCINRRYPLVVELFHWHWYKDKYHSRLKIASSP